MIENVYKLIRKPLIISGGVEDKTDQYIAIDKLVRHLSKDDYEISSEIDSDKVFAIGQYVTGIITERGFFNDSFNLLCKSSI